MDCLLSGGWTVADDENNGYARIVRFFMMKYLMVLLSLFSGSVLGMGRVNELCGIDSVKTIEIINLPSYVTTLVPLSKEGLNEIYRYKVVVNEIRDLYAGKIIDLLQMKYFRKEKYNNIRWGVVSFRKVIINVKFILMLLVNVEV